DLSDVMLTHYKLKEVRQQRLVLEPRGDYDKIAGIGGLGGHQPREREYEKLSQIIERLNDLFAGEHLTEKDKVAWLRTLGNKISEDHAVMAQIENNTEEQAMLGSFPAAVEKAVIDSMANQQDMSMEFLADKTV